MPQVLGVRPPCCLQAWVWSIPTPIDPSNSTPRGCRLRGAGWPGPRGETAFQAEGTAGCRRFCGPR